MLLIVEKVFTINSNAFGSSKYLLDKDFILFTLYSYQEKPQLKPLNETDQDIVWTAEGILPRDAWLIDEQSYLNSRPQLKIKGLIR